MGITSCMSCAGGAGMGQQLDKVPISIIIVNDQHNSRILVRDSRTRHPREARVGSFAGSDHHQAATGGAFW